MVFVVFVVFVVFELCSVRVFLFVMMMFLACGVHRNHKAAYRVTSTVNKASLIALFIRLLCECADDDDKERFIFYDSANTSSSEKAPRGLCMSECWYFGIL